METPLPLSKELLEQLRCPKTQQQLTLSTEEELSSWKDLDSTADQFLVSADGEFAYPIVDGYPILLLDRALSKKNPI